MALYTQGVPLLLAHTSKKTKSCINLCSSLLFGPLFTCTNSLTVAFTVQVETTDDTTYFEGLFVQARKFQSDSYDTGTFDVIGDSQLQVLTCGNDTADVRLLHASCFIISNIHVNINKTKVIFGTRRHHCEHVIWGKENGVGDGSIG